MDGAVGVNRLLQWGINQRDRKASTNKQKKEQTKKKPPKAKRENGHHLPDLVAASNSLKPGSSTFLLLPPLPVRINVPSSSLLLSSSSISIGSPSPSPSPSLLPALSPAPRFKGGKVIGGELLLEAGTEFDANTVVVLRALLFRPIPK